MPPEARADLEVEVHAQSSVIWADHFPQALRGNHQVLIAGV